MREVILPLVVIALIVTALIARRVLRPFLANSIALGAVVSALAYTGLEIVPRVRELSFFQPLRVRLEPQASFGALSDGRPSEIAVQIYRGDRLLEEQRIPALGQAAPAPVGAPLRLEPLESGKGFRVMAGSSALGELSAEAVAGAGLAAKADSVDPLPEVAESPPPAVPEIDPALAENEEIPVGELPQSAEVPSEPIESEPSAKIEPTATKPSAAKPKSKPRVRRTPARTQVSAADREVQLRARASQLSREGDNCEGGRLLREQGQEERSLALARELESRCRWGSGSRGQ